MSTISEVLLSSSPLSSLSSSRSFVFFFLSLDPDASAPSDLLDPNTDSPARELLPAIVEAFRLLIRQDIIRMYHAPDEGDPDVLTRIKCVVQEVNVHREDI